jgi:hypothetical protein
MASSYSDLKIELIGTGDQTGTWGTTTNNNFSVAISEAITGSADVAFSSSDVTVTLTDSNAAQTARNLRLNLTGTSGGARNLILGSGCQIEKLYLINNGLADAVTVKNTSGTGIAVPAGKSMFVYNNATNVVDAITHLSSLTLGSALPVASGGTGVTASTGTVAVVLSTSPTLITPVLGTPSSGTLSSCTVDGTNLVGYLNIPQNSKSADYTLVLADAGEQIFHPSADTTARTFTIPANSSVAYTIGTAITFINQNAAGVVTIAITTDTMRLAGAGTTGNRTLAANGIATCVKVTSTEWIISGTGLT